MTDYPALYEVETGELHPLNSAPGGTEVGRNSSAHIPIADLSCSRRQFRIIFSENNYFLEALSQTSPTLLDGTKVSTPTALSHADRIKAGKSEFIFVEHADDSLDVTTGSVSKPPTPQVEPEPPKPSSTPRTPRAGEVTIVGPVDEVDYGEMQEIQDEFQLDDRTLIGRDESSCDVKLPHPSVSRKHAQISRDASGHTITDLRSANGSFVNGQRLARPMALAQGDLIEIGPYLLVFTGRTLVASTSEGNLKLMVSHVTRRVKDKTNGNQIAILDDVSLAVEPNEFVVLLGPSGSGKSTLMNAISGRVPADEGNVYLNNENLYQNFEALKRNLSLVPQRDIVHSYLTVWQALYYTAKLRLPPDVSEQEISDLINSALETLGLSDRRDTRISFLSGGQVKRVSLANEIISRPSLLFLDEVTSGLDEQTDREMMSCFRKVTDTGKTVICITHSLTNVDRYCDLVVFMAPGGKLAFYGSPQEGLSFFGVPRLGDIYDKMEEKQPDEWERLYRQSNFYKKYVANRMPTATQIARHTVYHARTPRNELVRNCLRQLDILIRRYTRIVITERSSLAFSFGQAIFIAIMLWIFFGDLGRHDDHDRAANSAKLLFLLSTSCIWFGCNNAAKEIVKEQDIYKREKDVNLLAPSYYFSKVIVLAVIGVLQTLVLFWIVMPACNLGGSWFWQLTILNFATFNGMTLGLLISALSHSTDIAVTIVPIALIPQVIFAGMIAPLEGFAKFLAMVSTANYWAYDSLKATLPENLTALKNLWTGGPLLGEPGSIIGGLLVLVLFALLCAALALAALKWEDFRTSMLKTLISKTV